MYEPRPIHSVLPVRFLLPNLNLFLSNCTNFCPIAVGTVTSGIKAYRGRISHRPGTTAEGDEVPVGDGGIVREHVITVREHQQVVLRIPNHAA